eukprot:SAG22_NODE_557_length_9118_cov_9.050006_9_plen_131_part_00
MFFFSSMCSTHLQVVALEEPEELGVLVRDAALDVVGQARGGGPVGLGDARARPAAQRLADHEHDRVALGPAGLVHKLLDDRAQVRGLLQLVELPPDRHLPVDRVPGQRPAGDVAKRRGVQRPGVGREIGP